MKKILYFIKYIIAVGLNFKNIPVIANCLTVLLRLRKQNPLFVRENTFTSSFSKKYEYAFVHRGTFSLNSSSYRLILICLVEYRIGPSEIV